MRKHGIFQFALPDYKHIPPCALKRVLVAGIPLNIPGNFLYPISVVRFRLARASLAIVPMPPAPVNENDLPARWKHKVRLPWQIAAMNAEPVAHRMREAPDEHFGAGVLTLHRAHYPASVHYSSVSVSTVASPSSIA